MRYRVLKHIGGGQRTWSPGDLVDGSAFSEGRAEELVRLGVIERVEERKPGAAGPSSKEVSSRGV